MTFHLSTDEIGQNLDNKIATNDDDSTNTKMSVALKTNGHKPGKCTNLATEPESLCKPCYDKTSDELSDVSRDARVEGPRHIGRHLGRQRSEFLRLAHERAGLTAPIGSL